MCFKKATTGHDDSSHFFFVPMGGKAKFQKHSAKEMAAKANAHKDKGGGKEGSAKRLTSKNKLSFVCGM